MNVPIVIQIILKLFSRMLVVVYFLLVYIMSWLVWVDNWMIVLVIGHCILLLLKHVFTEYFVVVIIHVPQHSMKVIFWNMNNILTRLKIKIWISDKTFSVAGISLDHWMALIQYYRRRGGGGSRLLSCFPAAARPFAGWAKTFSTSTRILDSLCLLAQIPGRSSIPVVNRYILPAVLNLLLITAPKRQSPHRPTVKRCGICLRRFRRLAIDSWT